MMSNVKVPFTRTRPELAGKTFKVGTGLELAKEVISRIAKQASTPVINIFLVFSKFKASSLITPVNRVI